MLVLPPLDARKFIDLIGKNPQCKVQFEDMNGSAMNRPYKKYIQRIDEMERIIRFVTDELNKNPDLEITKNHIDEFMAHADYQLDPVEEELTSLYENFVRFKENNARLETELTESQEERSVVGTAMKWLQGSASHSNDPSAPLLGASERRLNNVAGVVAETDKNRFQRALWRASRGNTFIEFDPISTEKSVFVVYFQNSPDGNAQSAMMTKVLKVCNAFGVRLYTWPMDKTEASRRQDELAQVEIDKKHALAAFGKFMAHECAGLVAPVEYNVATKTSNSVQTGNSKIEDWRLFCVQEKSIYATLNMCQDDLTLRVNCWYPTNEEHHIKQILEKGNATSSMQAALVKFDKFGARRPPTYIQMNDFTEPWQNVIDTYGIPNYQTVNPAVITTVTFPFIFGMMYGDIGHGFLLFSVGLFLCLKGESFKYGGMAQIFEARFLVLQLGLFATFAGFMYNDLFGMVSLQLFDSRYENPSGDGHWTPKEGFDAENTGDGYGPYPFGVDWAWHGTSNELLYINSLKMKLSVLMGVIQMTLGLFLRVGNALHEGSKTDLICEALPMFVFMLCFFGFMDYMILYKWTHVIGTEDGLAGPPSIINSLICMAMFQADKQPLWPGSGDLAHTLMTCAAAAVPVMLFPKPFILLMQNNAKVKREAKAKANGEELDEEGGGGGHGHGGEFEFGEIFIHQIIETIEYVLGTVSHTASYLRIWALSLAHQQLSLVFYQKTLMMGLTAELAFPYNGIALYLLFGCWFGVTVGVLLGMDVLECFLHTLRLHWVEFQSKFYKSDSGVKFAPYSIRQLVIEAE